MIIRFKYGDADNIQDEYEGLFHSVDPYSFEDDEGNAFVIYPARTVIPQLHISIRDADWYLRNEDIEDPDDEEAWEYQDYISMVYDENEKNPESFTSWVSRSDYYALFEACNQAGYPTDEINELDCTIDSDEFFDQGNNGPWESVDNGADNGKLIDEFRDSLPTIFPELFAGQKSYRCILRGELNNRLYKFELINGMSDDDIPSFRYTIDFDNRVFKLVYNFNRYVEANSYEELVSKRNLILSDELIFTRVPEFQCKIYFDAYGVGFWANGQDSYCYASHSPYGDFNSTLAFATQCFCDAYQEYSAQSCNQCGYIGHEHYVEHERIESELAQAKQRKQKRADNEFENEHEFEVYIDEVFNASFSLKYSWDGVAKEMLLPRNIERNAVSIIFDSIFKMFLFG